MLGDIRALEYDVVAVAWWVRAGALKITEGNTNIQTKVEMK